MDPIDSIKLRWLHGALQDVTYERARSRFQFAPHTWEPAINAYRCEKCVRICVDLAGVERSQIDLTVEPQRVLIRGSRGSIAGDGNRLRSIRARGRVAGRSGDRSGQRRTTQRTALDFAAAKTM